jgi:hypothetical protein
LPEQRRSFVIFYSWQSDLPNSSNRGLIHDALERAAKRLRADDSIAIEPVIDRDTQGIAGAPDIAGTIFRKIDAADAVVSDVSIITPPDSARPSPNPNVLLELGYAIHARGWNRLVLVQNAHFGGPDLLPFDLRGRRALVYSSEPGDPDRASPRRLLDRQLEEALRGILNDLPAAVGELIVPASHKAEAIAAIHEQRRNRAAAVRRFAQQVVEQVVAIAPDLSRQDVHVQDLLTGWQAAMPFIDDFTEVALVAAEFDDHSAVSELYSSLELIAERYQLLPGVSGRFWEHQFEFFMMVGYEFLLILTAALLRERRFESLTEMLRRSLRIPNSPDREPQVAFHYLNPRTGYIVSQLRTPSGTQYLSPIGECFYKKYETRKASQQSVDLAELQSADMFLFLRASLPPNGSGEWAEWMGYIAVLGTEPPRFLMDAVRVSDARVLAAALAQPSPEALRDAIVDHGRRLFVNAFPPGYRLGAALATFKAERLGSQA